MNHAKVLNLADRLLSLTVADVMTSQIVTVSHDQTMADAAETLRSHHITTAAVLDDAGRCVGMVSAGDFLHPEHDHDINLDALAENMSTGVQMIAGSASLMQAARIMDSTHLHHLPVLDEQQRIVGMVSTIDIVAALVHAVDESEETNRHRDRRGRESWPR